MQELSRRVPSCGRGGRRHEAPVSQIAKDFGMSRRRGISGSRKPTLRDGTLPGVTEREAASSGVPGSGPGCWSRRMRSSARERRSWPASCPPKMDFPLVRDLAAGRFLSR